jgi:hypothetical protein
MDAPLLKPEKYQAKRKGPVRRRRGLSKTSLQNSAHDVLHCPAEPGHYLVADDAHRAIHEHGDTTAAVRYQVQVRDHVSLGSCKARLERRVNDGFGSMVLKKGLVKIGGQ